MHYFLGMPLPDVAKAARHPAGDRQVPAPSLARRDARLDRRRTRGRHDRRRRRAVRMMFDRPARTPTSRAARGSRRAAHPRLLRRPLLADRAHEPAAGLDPSLKGGSRCSRSPANPLCRRCRGGPSSSLLLLVAALAASLLLAAARPKPPPLFGPAGNGLVVMSRDGDILTVDPRTGVTTVDRDRPRDRQRPRVVAGWDEGALPSRVARSAGRRPPDDRPGQRVRAQAAHP